jgi:hypothetical protein
VPIGAAHQKILTARQLPFGPAGRMLGLGQATLDTGEGSMSKTGLDNRHRDKDGEISHKHGNTLVRTLRKIYGPGFAAGYSETEKLSEVLHQLNETSLSQLRRDHETGHLEHKITKASK